LTLGAAGFLGAFFGLFQVGQSLPVVGDVDGRPQNPTGLSLRVPVDHGIDLHPAHGTTRLQFRFHARDLHLVLGPAANGNPVRFRVRLDGAAPGTVHGSDLDPAGEGTIRQQRLYQLIRQPGEVGDHTFEIEFLEPGAQAFAFTFG